MTRKTFLTTLLAGPLALLGVRRRGFRLARTKRIFYGKPDWELARRMFMQGQCPWNICAKTGVAMSALRKHMRKHEWPVIGMKELEEYRKRLQAMTTMKPGAWEP